MVESQVEDAALIAGIDPGQANNLASHVKNNVETILSSINPSPGGTNDNTPINESATYSWSITNTTASGPVDIVLGLETNETDALNQIFNLGFSGFNFDSITNTFNNITNTSNIVIQHSAANWSGSISLEYRALTSQGSGGQGSININFQLGF